MRLNRLILWIKSSSVTTGFAIKKGKRPKLELSNLLRWTNYDKTKHSYQGYQAEHCYGLVHCFVFCKVIFDNYYLFWLNKRLWLFWRQPGCTLGSSLFCLSLCHTPLVTERRTRLSESTKQRDLPCYTTSKSRPQLG